MTLIPPDMSIEEIQSVGTKSLQMTALVRTHQERSIAELERQLADGHELIGFPGEEQLPREVAAAFVARLRRNMDTTGSWLGSTPTDRERPVISAKDYLGPDYFEWDAERFPYNPGAVRGDVDYRPGPNWPPSLDEIRWRNGGARS